MDWTEREISEIKYAYLTLLRSFERFSIWFLHFLNVLGRVFWTVWRAIAVVSEPKFALRPAQGTRFSYHLPLSAPICDFLRLSFAAFDAVESNSAQSPINFLRPVTGMSAHGLEQSQLDHVQYVSARSSDPKSSQLFSPPRISFADREPSCDGLQR
jgi:hypothetical protein